MNASSPAKLHDVARHAAVSTATVSRYLNNPELVAPATAERIRSAIETLNYIPNMVAGSLASNRSKQIAIMVPYLTTSIREGIESLVEQLEAGGMVAMLGLTGLDPERTNEKLLMSIARRVDAVVTAGIVPEPARTALRKNKMTVIETWGLPDDPVDVAIGFSHREVGAELARFAIRRGYRRPHIITGLGERARRRRDAFMGVWEETGLAPPTEEVVTFPTDYGHGRAAFAFIQQLPERPDVVICGSDFLAQALIVEAQAAGLTVPGDLAVIGFGHTPLAQEMRPTITSVHVDGDRLAREALEVIRRRVAGEEIEERRIDIGFSIIARESA